MRETGTEVVGTTALDTVEGLLALVEGDVPSGRHRAADLAAAVHA